jgi:hypothetical protein
MNTEFKRPDAGTRAKNIADLRESSRLLDLCTLELDEAIAALDKHLIQQHQARLLHRSNSISKETTES